MDAHSWVTRSARALVPTAEELQELRRVMPADKEGRMVLTIHGKSYPIPRSQMLFGDASYSYSGMTVEPNPDIPALVARCIEYARAKSPEYVYGGALVNQYLDGADYVSMHSDDERDLTPGAPIYSFSFGATRMFDIKAKDPGRALIPSKRFELGHGDVVVMGGRLQRGFRHGVPKTAKKVGWRINVTVRSFRASAAGAVAAGSGV